MMGLWWQDLCAATSTCWDSVSASLTPQLQQLQQLLPSFSGGQEEVWVGSRRFRVLRRLGEGG